MDLRGATIKLASRKAVDVFKGIAAVDQPNYPETMGCTLVVNAPWVFTAIWSVVRVFLDEGVTAKVNILGEGEPSRKALLKQVHPSQLPAFLGGDCRCPGGCVSGPSCTAPRGMVASQHRIEAYCARFAAAVASGMSEEESLPLEAPEQPSAGAPAEVGPPKRTLTRSLAFRKPDSEPARVSLELLPWQAAQAAAEAAATAAAAEAAAAAAAAEAASAVQEAPGAAGGEAVERQRLPARLRGVAVEAVVSMVHFLRAAAAPRRGAEDFVDAAED